MGKSNRPLAVDHSDFLQALERRAARIGGLVRGYSTSTKRTSVGMRLLECCYAAAKDDLRKASKGEP